MKHKRKYKFWSDDKINFLKNNYGSMEINEIVSKLDAKSIGSVRTMAHLLGLTRKQDYKKWSLSEEQFLENNYKKFGNNYLAQKLGRSFHSVSQKLISKNLKREQTLINKWRSNVAKKNKGREHSENSRKNMSLARVGMRLTKEHKKKIKESCSGKINLGERNGNWNNGSSFEGYNKEFNRKFKLFIRKRDNQVCMLCGIHREKLSVALHIHHVNYDKKCTIPQNCISLCNPCHGKTQGNREQWINFFQSLLTKRYGYEYSENKEIILEVK